MPYTVVIADDVTGANDIGIMYAKRGLSTCVYSSTDDSGIEQADCDVLVVDTDSRFDIRERAYEKVSGILKKTSGHHVEQYIGKQCSVFRGNIGAEFDAMLDALGEKFAVVVLGFPDNGRTTIDSIHHVYGVPLAQSQFRSDPVHPMTESDLRIVLQGQTKRRVGAIHWDNYERGENFLLQALGEAREQMDYCIMDVRNNADLELLARVLQHEKIICGSSALSSYLARIKVEKERQEEVRPLVRRSQNVLCMAGSLTPQTAEQTVYMKDHGYPVITLDTTKIFETESRQAECRRITKEAARAYETGTFVMIHSMNAGNQVAETKKLASEHGLDNTEVSSMVSAVLSELAAELAERFSIRRLIVCGGDTSASLCARLGIRGMRVLTEIEPGLPTCESLTKPYYRMVLKSGSFGSVEFIERAKETLLLEEDG